MNTRDVLTRAAWVLCALGAACDDRPAADPDVSVAEPRRPDVAPPQRTTIVGRIVDALGQPVPRCGLTLLAASGPPLPEVRATTGEDGTFALTPPSLDRSFVLVVAHPRFPPRVLGPAVGEDLGDVVLESVLGCEVQVTRVAPGGVVADARVRLEPLLFDPRLPDASLLRRTAQSGADGRAMLYGVRPGTWRLTVEAPGLTTVQRLHVQPAAPDGPPRVPVPMMPGHRLVGRVVDAGGRPVEGARVEAFPERPDTAPAAARTSADGSFRVTGLPEGRVRLRAAVDPDRAAAADASVPASEGIELRLTPLPPVTGTLVDAETGAPIQGAGVVATPLERLGSATIRVRTGPDGRFDLGHPFPGRYELELTSKGHVPVCAGPIDLRDASPLSLAMLPAEEVAGTIVDASGRPLPGAEIEMVPAAFDGSAFAQFALESGPRTPGPVRRSAPDGGFRTTVPRGTFRLLIRARGHAPLLSERLDASGGPVTGTTLRLRRGAVVRGTALQSDGTPASGVVVCIDPLPGGVPDRLAATTAADAEGRFEFGPLSAGPYELFYYSPDRDRTARALARDRVRSGTPVVLRDGEPLRLELTRR